MENIDEATISELLINGDNNISVVAVATAKVEENGTVTMDDFVNEEITLQNESTDTVATTTVDPTISSMDAMESNGDEVDSNLVPDDMITFQHRPDNATATATTNLSDSTMEQQSTINTNDCTVIDSTTSATQSVDVIMASNGMQQHVDYVPTADEIPVLPMTVGTENNHSNVDAVRESSDASFGEHFDDTTSSTEVVQQHHANDNNNNNYVAVDSTASTIVRAADDNNDVDNDHDEQLPPISIDTNAALPVSNDDDDNFGAFDEAAMMNAQSSITEPILLNNNNDDTDLGIFESNTAEMTIPIPTTTDHGVPTIDDGNVDDSNDFGDFDTAEASPPPVSTDENIQMDDDDDDFGDFDEAPAVPVPLEGEGFGESSTSPRGLESLPTSGSSDPIVEKLKYVIPTVFKRYILEDETTVDDDYDTIPCFAENEIVSIDSVMISLEADLPLNKRTLSNNSIYPIEKLFPTGNASDIDTVAHITPPRYIVSKNVVPSPTVCPLNGHVIVSDRTALRRLQAMTAEHQGGGFVVAADPRTGSDRKAIDRDTVPPSEKAKAFLERIPDLSYMLSTKLSIPNTK